MAVYLFISYNIYAFFFSTKLFPKIVLERFYDFNSLTFIFQAKVLNSFKHMLLKSLRI